MAELRTYFDTETKVYNLLNDHPVMNKMITEFEIDVDNVRNVALYLIENHTTISETNLSEVYYTSEIIETIGELYGFILPFDNQVSSFGTTLFELLNMTIYLYKFGTTSNFYEKNILGFLPEYDRENIENEPKLKLLYETIGRKLDNIELKVSEMKNLYSIDDVPEDLLDYLGQNIGYEKEDYTLENVSFRELLKNIIEIYKIKGTNYSFSFFFKFLGFEITLKEFFFNHDVKNPEGFPGVEENKVEYYLSTKNPILDISNNKPAHHLEQIKNINDWELELTSLEEKGCTNAIQYMLGFESFNNISDNPVWHTKPWTYFKTNLIEYSLDPFVNKLNLSSNDNETIRKYVKFLSPTYLFTWINVNLRPWIEDINVIKDSDDWNISIINNLGDVRPTPLPWVGNMKTAEDEGFNGFDNDGNYYDYEPLDKILEIYKNGETLSFSVENNMNLGGCENIGTTLTRNGIYIRQPGHPKFISNITHAGDKKISFDFMEVGIRDFIDENNVTKVNYYIDLPTTVSLDGAIYYVKYDSDEPFGYYSWNEISQGWIYISQDDYSYRPYPATPVSPQPNNNQTLSESNIVSFIWEEIKDSVGYWIQVATDSQFKDIILDIDYLSENIYSTVDILEYKQTLLTNAEDYLSNDDLPFDLNYYPHDAKFSNNKYYWRVKVKNSSTFPNLPSDNSINPEDLIWSPWSNQWQFTLKAYPFPYNQEIVNKETIFVSTNSDSSFSSFSVKWDNIAGSEKYQIQILENKPYTWVVKEGLWFTDTFDNLPIDKEIGIEYYVVNEKKFYTYTSSFQNWVSIPKPNTYSTIDFFEDLPSSEQKIGDSWFVENDNSYYRWQSTQNDWIISTNTWDVLGNIDTIDLLQNTDDPIYSIYFVQASNEFYQYVPIEETTQTITTKYDSIVNENALSVSLENGIYYWRIRSYNSGEWLDWQDISVFTIDF